VGNPVDKVTTSEVGTSPTRSAATGTGHGARVELARDLTVSHAVAVVVGCIIGTGIFLVPAEMMQAAGSSGLVYLAWLAGALLSFFGALTYAELGAMKPEAGGEYVYMRDAYGPLGGFLYAWTTFLISKPGSIATIATGIVRITGSFGILAFLVDPAPGHPLTFPGRLLAIALALLVSLVNYLGVKRAGIFQLVFTVLKLAIIAAVIVVAFGWSGGTFANFGTAFSGAMGGLSGFMVALVAALWAYDGWNDINMVAGEVRSPGRNIPAALITGVALVAGLYMLVNAAVQYVMPAPAIAASARPASDAVRLALGGAAASLIAGLMALQMLGTLNGAVLGGARVPFAVARDGYLFSPLAQVHPRFRTPSTAIAVQAALTTVLLLFGGSFQQLFFLTLFAEWLFYMLTATTLFVFRHRQPDASRPYKVWGYPLVPALFIAASGFLLYYTFVENLRNSILGLLVVLTGVPAYFVFARKRRRGCAHQAL
jgi:APA family basic amino acid/polyamine antiporter